jgi:hypothetical protein
MPAKSKKQQRFMGMVHQCQKTGDCASSEVEKIAASIKADDAKDFAETKHKNLPEKVKKKKKVAAESITFREFILQEAKDAKGQAIRDNVKGIMKEPIESDEQKPSTKRRGQRSVRALRRRYGLRHPEGMQSEGYYERPPIDTERYPNREHQGLEGPFGGDDGKVYYYDPKEGKYYDPDSDIYLSSDEYEATRHSEEKRTELMNQQRERDFARRR